MTDHGNKIGTFPAIVVTDNHHHRCRNWPLVISPFTALLHRRCMYLHKFTMLLHRIAAYLHKSTMLLLIAVVLHRLLCFYTEPQTVFTISKCGFSDQCCFIVYFVSTQNIFGSTQILNVSSCNIRGGSILCTNLINIVVLLLWGVFH